MLPKALIYIIAAKHASEIICGLPSAAIAGVAGLVKLAVGDQTGAMMTGACGTMAWR
jgi:hypothetical protein